MSAYEDYLNSLQQQDTQKQQLVTSLSEAATTNPDEFASMVKLSKAAKISMDALPSYKEEAQQTKLLGEVGLERLWRDAPKTSAFLALPDNAKLAHDDVENLSIIEKVLRPVATSIRSIGRFPGDISAALYGVGETVTGTVAPLLDPLAGTILPENPLRRVAAGLSDFRKRSQRGGDIIQGGLPQDAGVLERNLYGASRSFGNQLPGLAATLVTRNPAYALGSAAVLEGGGAASDALDKGATPLQALALGSTNATAEVFFERFGVNRLLKDIAADSGFGKMLLGQIIREVPGEMTTTLVQQANEWAILNPGKSVDQFVAELGPAERDTVISTIMQTVMTAGLGRGVSYVANRTQRAQQSEEQTKILTNLNQLAAANKVLQRDQETFEQFVAQAAENGPVQQVFIDANTLMQSGIAEQLAAVSPAVAAQLETAVQTGGQIAIPVEEYTARIAPTEYAQSLIDHLKTDPEGFSRAEAQEYMQNSAAELQAEIERTLTEKEGDDSFKASAEAVRATIKTQLDTTARFTPQVNEAYSSMVGNFYAVTAARLDTTPEALYQRYPLRVAAEGISGAQQFDQALASQPPKGWKHSTDGADAAAMWKGQDGTEAVFWTDLKGKLEQDVPAVAGYSHSVNRSTVTHIRKQHGDTATESERGQLPVTASDLARIPEIVTSYDAIRADLQGDGGAPEMAFSKRVSDGVLVYLARVSSKRSNLSAVSMWKFPAETDAATVLDHAVKEKAPRNAGPGDALRPLSDYESDAQAPSLDNSIDGSGQKFNQGARGAFNPATLQISLLKNADLSTFLHESGHFFLEVQADIVAQLQQKPADSLTVGERELVADMDALLKWFGVSDLTAWHTLDFEAKRKHHEKFAESFEAYLFEGKAPSIELQPLFQQFRAFLLNVYKSLKDFIARHPDAGTLNAEVRSVFDRMLATTEQIQLAERGRSMMPLFTSAEQASMTAEEFAAYQSLGVLPTSEAIQELEARGLRDMRWLHNARGREITRLQKEFKAARKEAEAEVRAKVMAQPVYRAWELLKRAATDDAPAVRLNRAALSEMYGGAADGKFDRYALLDWKRLTDQRMTAEDGLHPDMVADLIRNENGSAAFGSGDELVRALVAAELPSVEINALTDVRMLERHGDLNTPEAIERAADKAIHNEVRTRMVATEANALSRAVGQRRVLESAAKEFAANIVAREKVRHLRPSKYASAGERAARAAEKASKAGDLATAAAEKRNQLIQIHATRAAYEAQTEVDNRRREWSALANRADDRLVKSYDIDLVNAVRAILGEYGIAEKRAKRAGDYLTKLQEYDPQMFGIIQASVQAAEANAKPFRDMTVEEVRGLSAEIDAIMHLARRSRQMEVDGDLIDRQEVEEALRRRMEEIGVPNTVPGEASAITTGEQRMVQFKTALASMRRVESWAGQMDGMQAIGPFRRYLWNRIKDSADAYRSDKAKYLKQFRNLFDAIAPTMKPGLLHSPELNYTFGKDSGGSAINEIVHAILHTGNDSNKRKLLLGRNWVRELPDGSLDTTRWDAFISRMAAEGRITKAHFDFAQGVWDLLESMKPMAQKTHRDVFGKYFDEVTANPLQTPFGIYAGGYVPAMADSRVVTDAKLRALSEEENAGMAYAFPSTPKGFTKARTEYNRPLLLDLRTLAQHIDKVLLFSHMEMPVRDVQSVLKRVGGTLDRLDSGIISGMLTPWLNRAARQQVTTPITADAGVSRFLTTLRSRAGAAAMFGNLANAAQQITGFSLAAVKVRPALLLSATVDYVKHPRQFAAVVSDASPYMAERLENEVAAMTDDINQILLNPSLIERGQAWSMRHAYFLQTAVDSAMSPIIWTAAYNQALEQGAEHRDAVRLADSAVRETQGSTLPEDVSRVETGNAWVRLFTQFAGYFNMQANLMGAEFAKTMQAYGLRKGAGRGMYILLLGFMVPAIAGELVMQLFRGGPGDEDKDGEFLDDWLAALFFWAPLRNATAMIPYGGQGINSAVNAWNSKPYDDRMASSPAISMVESAVKAPVSVYKAVADDGSAQKAVRDVATLISISVGLPANLAARPLGYLAGVADNRIEPTGPVDAVRGVVTGIASPESRQ